MIPPYLAQFSQGHEGQSSSAIWTAPSNIALVKYWGKFGTQWPKNPSLSLTLSKATTRTEFAWSAKSSGDAPIVRNFLFEGQAQASFQKKIENFFQSLRSQIDCLNFYQFDIKSENTFPHSAGIASSASSMAALCVGFTSCLAEIYPELSDKDNFFKLASSLSRRASGSACRSVFGGVVSWGADRKLNYALPVKGVDSFFLNLHDDILLIAKEEKEVSSTMGHSLMNGHPFAEARFLQAADHYTKLKAIMTQTNEINFAAFADIVETEALSLHAMMMTSTPSYSLMKPATLEAIARVRKARSAGLDLCFTLDAGPNLHLIYPDHVATEAKNFIEKNLFPLSVEGNSCLRDYVGQGPTQERIH